MSETLSQQEIEALLQMGESSDRQEAELTAEEMDVLGEISNISMGAAATNLSVLINRKVLITTPVVRITNMMELEQEYASSSVAVEVEYTEGLEGTNLFVMEEEDAKTITGQTHLIDITEVVNQMMGTGSASLAMVLKQPISIAPSKTAIIDFQSEGHKIIKEDNVLIQVTFTMEIEGLLASHITQVMSLSFGRRMVEKVLSSINEVPKSEKDSQVHSQTAYSPGFNWILSRSRTTGITIPISKAHCLRIITTLSNKSPPCVTSARGIIEYPNSSSIGSTCSKFKMF